MVQGSQPNLLEIEIISSSVSGNSTVCGCITGHADIEINFLPVSVLPTIHPEQRMPTVLSPTWWTPLCLGPMPAML
jgi:hypothetical protein